MALIALAADKGAPGVTTAAVALAAVWPRRALLAEVDTAGGDLVYRSPGTDGRPLDPNTGMLSLAATARRGLAPEQLWDHAQRLSGGLEILVGLGTAEQSAGLAGQWDTLGRAFAALGDSPHPQLAADVIADCGRIGPSAGSVALFPHAALVLLIARTEPEQLARVRDRALALTAALHGEQRGMAQLAQPLIGVLLVTEAQRAAKVAGQVNDMLVASRAGAQVMGVLAHDPAGAQQLAGRRRGRVDRSLLVRSVRKVAADLHQQYGAAWSGTARPRTGAASPGEVPAAGQPSPGARHATELPPVPGGAPGPGPSSRPGTTGTPPGSGTYGTAPGAGSPSPGAGSPSPGTGAKGTSLGTDALGTPLETGAQGTSPGTGAYGAPSGNGAYGAPSGNGAYGAPSGNGAYGAPDAPGAPPVPGARSTVSGEAPGTAPATTGAHGGRATTGAYSTEAAPGDGFATQVAPGGVYGTEAAPGGAYGTRAAPGGAGGTEAAPGVAHRTQAGPGTASAAGTDGRAGLGREAGAAVRPGVAPTTGVRRPEEGAAS
ncbi:hypothetical protein [Streptomyces albus]|uniref:Uncharacterized protein n=1 Tax=Streptomyces albus TaxID=1888 RepID=A0A8H1QS86_9ACTN|nr:hypothetical protein [Streptomyces albus]TGG83515.1 hypothetical protein D8771_16045 [Streptomyces albus]UVN56728.1 hypothetical protein NR995_21070 [Streptomyces albus]